MKFIGRIYRILAWPFIWIRGLVPEALEAPQGLVPRVSHNIGFTRTLFAPFWRRFSRGTIVFLGFAIYIGLQLGLAYMIDQLWWWYIAAFFIIVGWIVFTYTKPLSAFIVWLFISPLAFIFLRMDFGEGVPAITFDRVVLFLLCFILIGRTLLYKYPIKRPIMGEWLMLVFIAVTFISLVALRPDSIGKTLQVVSEKFDHIGLGLIAYFVAKSVLREKKHIVWATIALVLTGIYVAGFGYYEHYTGNMWFSSFVGSVYKLTYKNIEQGRSTGPLINPAAYGAFLGITSFLAFHLAIYARRKASKLFYITSMVFMIIGCYFCMTRSGYIPLAVILLLMPLLARGCRKQYFILFAIAAVIGLIAIPVILQNPNVNDRLTKKSTIYNRFVITAGTINVIKHHPLFGVGLGNIDDALEQYITNAGTLSGVYARGRNPMLFYPMKSLSSVITSHNSILTIFAEQGLIGGFIFVAALIAFLVYLLYARTKLPDNGILGNDYVSLVMVAVIGHLASISGYDIRFFKYPAYVLWILIALGVRAVELNRQEQQKEARAIRQEEYVGELTHA